MVATIFWFIGGLALLAIGGFVGMLFTDSAELQEFKVVKGRQEAKEEHDAFVAKNYRDVPIDVVDDATARKAAWQIYHLGWSAEAARTDLNWWDSDTYTYRDMQALVIEIDQAEHAKKVGA